MTAGQDIILGTTGAGSSYGDVNANAFGNPSAAASVVLNAGRDVTIQGTGTTDLDASNGGTITVTAARYFTMVSNESDVSTTNGGAGGITINANDMIINDSIARAPEGSHCCP